MLISESPKDGGILYTGVTRRPMAFPVGFRDLSKTTKIDAEEQTALSGTLLICMSRTSSLPRRSRPPNPKTIEIVTHRFPEVFPESFPERNPRIQFYESVEKLAPGSASRNTSRNATPGFPERFPEPFPEPPPPIPFTSFFSLAFHPINLLQL